MSDNATQERAHVVYFPKPCPKCGDALRRVVKFSGEWWECPKCEPEVPMDEEA